MILSTDNQKAHITGIAFYFQYNSRVRVNSVILQMFFDIFISKLFFCSFVCNPVRRDLYKKKKFLMVKLGFKLKINAPLSQVWQYYSNFENIVEWDPNTTYCKEVRPSPNKIGGQYLLKSLFNGKESSLIYTVYNVV